jgi:hypothetical protein
MPSIDHIIAASQEVIADEAVQTAKYGSKKALFEAATASMQYEKSQLALKEQEIMLQRARNFNRPSILLGAEIERVDGQYIAVGRGLRVSGNSPEQAFLEFDRTWTQGDE